MDRRSRPRLPYHGIRLRSTRGVVLTCEHASNRLPPSIRPDASERVVLRTHWGYDIGGWAVTRAVARILDAPAIGGRWSRLLADLNRRVDDPTFVREIAGGIRLSWNADLRRAERIARALTIHAAYHAALDRLLAARVAVGVRPVLLAIHTFTPELDGERRPFDAGVLYDADRGPAIRCATVLRAAGLLVRYNEPYSGRAGMMYSVDRHGRHYGLPCLELELNQRLFDRAGAAQRLGRIIAESVRV